MSGFSDLFRDQIDALETAREHALSRIPVDSWSFGGGTALSLFHFAHRRSYDIDIFVHDPQYFAYLSPKWYIDETGDFQSRYTELAHHISLTTHLGIKVDLLLASMLSAPGAERRTIGGIECRVETVKEIIAKKIRYRLPNPNARDLFDLAVALEKQPTLLVVLWEERVVTLDELHQWRSAVTGYDETRYRQDIEVIEPREEYLPLALEAPVRVVAAIDQVKKAVDERLR